MTDRLTAWRRVSGNTIDHVTLDVATEWGALQEVVDHYRPGAIVHFAEQRAAPYSMKDAGTRRYTTARNTSATHNVLEAMVAAKSPPHLVHLGSTGVYGYGFFEGTIPEGYITLTGKRDVEILHPQDAGSVYHMTKCMDELMFQFYAKNYGLRITDLHQGIVWGTQTEQTRMDGRLVNRFDYDGDYGTVLNRFLMQAAVNYPLTVHGTGGQTRAFIHIQDTVRCILAAVEVPPDEGARPRIVNQMAETRSVLELAQLVSKLTGADINHLPNPRKEAIDNTLAMSNQTLIDLGIEPITLEDRLLEEVVEVAKRHAGRADVSKIPCTSRW
jgi:UDP-sulfoquinovose synthase